MDAMGSKRKEFLGARKDDVEHGPSTTFFPKLNAQRLQFSL